MIYFNCDIGYARSQPTNISEVTFLDFDRPFTIFTSNHGNEGYTSFDSLELLYEYVYSVLGEDVFATYEVPGNGIFSTVERSYNELLKFFPSFPLAYPNSFSFWKEEKQSKYYWVLRIKKLKNFIICRKVSRTESNANCGRYEESSGKITYKYDTNLGFINLNPYNFPEIMAVNMGFSGYTQPKDLIDGTKLFYMSVEYTKNNEVVRSRTIIGTSNYNKFLVYMFGDNPPEPDGSIIPTPNPFDPVPPSFPNTPGGQFDDQSDIIGDSSLPTLSASDTGFTRIYIPTLSQVKDLARYLWTDDTLIETIWNKIKQFFENPMEAIIGFNLVPVSVPSSGTKSFALMYIDTGVDMDTAANQFVDVDCGTLPIQFYYGSALDYSPYTKISCYLPYIGMVQLNTDEVVGRTLQVKYRIDIVSGSCVAKIFVDGNCIYQYSGHCAITIPIAASDFSSYVSAAISVAKLAVGAATGGAGGAAAAALNADVNQQTGSMFSVQGGSDNSGQIQLFAQGGASGPGTQAEPEIKNTHASFSGITPQNVANTVGEIMTAKPHVQHSGSFSGNSGYLGVRRPFVIIERPNLCLPENYQGLNGFPAMITMLLGECSGYTKVQQMVLSGCTATNPEQAEIMSLLKGGVIF